MNLPTLRFNGDILPHNPHTLKVYFSRDVKQVSIPYEGEIFGDYGRKARIVSGDGEICGNNAFDFFLKLVNLHDSGAVGVLSIPDIPPFYAILKELTLTREPKNGVIGYSFKFIEKVDIPINSSTNSARAIILEKESNLWEIAAMHGLQIEALVRKNPSIETPFSFIPVGSEVLI